MSMGLSERVAAALDALIAAVQLDRSALQDNATIDDAGATDALFQAVILRLEGARTAERVRASGHHRDTFPRIYVAPRKVSISSLKSNISDESNAESGSELPSRQRGLILDEIIIDHALHRAALFSIDEIVMALRSHGISTPRASLVTKLSRMTDAGILKRPFRGAYEKGPNAERELDRTRRWHDIRR
jgi:hypothetical protein